eukprot:jgi/Tetstr1/457943/TSEL_044460.t3
MEAEGHSGLAAGASTCPARGRRERDAQPEACQRCSSGRSLSRSVLNPLRDLPGRVRVDGSARCDVRATRRQWGSGLVLPHHLPEERDCETFRVAGSPVRSGRGVARWSLPRLAAGFDRQGRRRLGRRNSGC